MILFNALDNFITNKDRKSLRLAFFDASDGEKALLKNIDYLMEFYESVDLAWQQAKDTKYGFDVAYGLLWFLDSVPVTPDLLDLFDERFVTELVHEIYGSNEGDGDTSTQIYLMALGLFPLSDELLHEALDVVQDNDYFCEDFLATPALKCPNEDRKYLLKALEVLCFYYINEIDSGKEKASKYFLEEIKNPYHFPLLNANHIRQGIDFISESEYRAKSWQFPDEALWS